MKTMDCIEKLSEFNPIINICLKAFHAGHMSEVEALREMVCHLAENLHDLQRLKLSELSKAPIILKVSEDANSFETIDPPSVLFQDSPEDPFIRAFTPNIMNMEIEELTAMYPEVPIDQPPKIDPPLTETQVRIRRLDIPDEEPIKKKRGWPW